MGISHGWDLDRVLQLGAQLEKTVGRRLRSEAIMNGRTAKEGHPEYERAGLPQLKSKLGEAPYQKLPAGW
jgi:hydroxymethylglutaryl-CoA lyase